MKLQIYKYAPKKEIKNAAVFSGICLFSAATLMIIPVFILDFRIIYQLSAVIFATAGVQITSRFIISSYIYILDETNFIIVKISGRKPTQVCNVSLETAIGISKNLRHLKHSGKSDKSDNLEKKSKLPESEYQSGETKIKMNFCQNMFPDKTYTYDFEFNQKKSAVIFEADENFVAEMRSRINYAKIKAKSDEEM